jgi:hypothetical protein
MVLYVGVTQASGSQALRLRSSREEQFRRGEWHCEAELSNSPTLNVCMRNAVKKKYVFGSINNRLSSVAMCRRSIESDRCSSEAREYPFPRTVGLAIR